MGLFIRTLVGLDREAAKQAFAEFLSGKAQTASQIEFVNLIIDHLTEHGVMDARRLYESPFTDISPQGPEGLFGSDQVDRSIAKVPGVTGVFAASGDLGNFTGYRQGSPDYERVINIATTPPSRRACDCAVPCRGAIVQTSRVSRLGARRPQSLAVWPPKFAWEDRD